MHQAARRDMWFIVMLILPMLPHICRTECLSYPSELAGSCVPIQECPYLMNYLDQAKKGQTDALTILRRSACSKSDTRVKVCCPPEIVTQRLQGGLPEDCGRRNNTERIVGGENAPLAAWPWMALLRASGGTFESWVCGGVLISARYVLTAAHCVVHDIYTIEFVRLGELVLNEDPDKGGNLTAPSPQDIPVQQVIAHPEYKSPCRRCNDIALIRLAYPARLDNMFVAPICISNNPSRDVGISSSHFTDDKAWVAGWGATTQDPHFYSQATHLQDLQVPLRELPFCRDRKQDYPDPNMIVCAGGETHKDTCRGDSGGPLMISSPDLSWYTIGIVSFGNTICGAREAQTVFTNVSFYAQWIEENMLP